MSGAPGRGARSRRAAARRAGKLSAEEAARQLEAPAPLLRRRIRQGEIAVDADRMLEPAELERIRARFACRADCGRVALGKMRYCREHSGLGRRGQKRTPEQRARIAAGMQGRPRPAVSGVMRARWEDAKQRDVILKSQRGGRERAHQALEQVKAELDRLDVADVVAVLRARGIRRSTTTVAEHIRQGWLVAKQVRIEGMSGRPPYLATRADVDAYVERIAGHADGRLRRFDANPRFRGRWYRATHGTSGEFGRLSRELGDPTNPPGPKRYLTPEEEAKILRHNSAGRTQQEIANDLSTNGRRVTRDHVRGVLARAKAGDNPPASAYAWGEPLPERPSCPHDGPMPTSGREELRRALAEAANAGRPAYRVAKAARIDPTTLSRIVTGQRTPHRLTREAIAAALGLKPEDLFPDLERADAANAA